MPHGGVEVRRIPERYPPGTTGSSGYRAERLAERAGDPKDLIRVMPAEAHGLIDPRELRLMVVTTGTLAPRHGHLALVEAAIEGGATAVQLRAPELTDLELLPLAADLAVRCRAAEVLFIVNDRLGVAVQAGADGVHLGQSDRLTGARERLGADVILGISVAGAEQAVAAAALGADYLGVTVWATDTKPEATGTGPAGVREVCDAASIPVVGIGGIDTGNLDEVFDAGASGIAVISAVAADPDPASATRTLRRHIDRREEGSVGTANG